MVEQLKNIVSAGHKCVSSRSVETEETSNNNYIPATPAQTGGLQVNSLFENMGSSRPDRRWNLGSRIYLLYFLFFYFFLKIILMLKDAVSSALMSCVSMLVSIFSVRNFV